MAHEKARAKLLARAKKRQAKRAKAAEAAEINPLNLPTDKEIAEKIEEAAKWWLTTPGVPVGMSPQSPLWDPLFGSQTTSVVEGVPLTQTPWVPPGTIVPEFIRQAIRDFQFPGSTGPPKKPKPERTPKQLMNDELQSVALSEVNLKARKKDGQFKKGWSQKRVMKEAQKRCTKERERLGLCKRKSTKKGQVRKTARRAYDSRLGLTRRRR